MALEGNTIPDQVRRIHMTAACGTGMGALACMLQDLGYEVTGSDRNIYPPMSDFLARKGVRLLQGFSADHLDPAPDLVIIGNAVTRDNPEACCVMEKKMPYCSMPQALNRFVAGDRRILLVTGTHGKTTTSALMAHLLDAAGLDPTFMIGGILNNFNSNYRLGSGPYVVMEGDEYDTAFFDKGPKFLHYRPTVAVINGIEFDHADIFRDVDHIKSAFSALIRNIPEDALILARGGDEHTRDVTAGAGATVRFFGRPQDDWSCWWEVLPEKGSLVQINGPDGPFPEMVLPMWGEHNVMNTLAAVGTLAHLGVSPEILQKGLETFQGVKRRQEIRGVRSGITVMDDFAHHPTAVAETLKALKPACAAGRLIAVFEPRTNTSMRDVFQAVYTRAFDAADMVCVRRPSCIDKVPEGQRISTRKLVRDIHDRGIPAHGFDTTEDILEFLKASARPGDLILVMSNGGFDNIHQRLLDIL